jgi:histidinol-phosphate aminotransferase
MAAEPKLVPLRDHRYDLEALAAAVGPRTKIVYVCHPNNPTGTSNDRSELDAYFDAVPSHVLTVVDQAYYEYVEDAGYCDAVDAYFKEGRNVLVLRTFSKIYGLAGLRVGYGVGPEEIVRELGKVRRAFDVSTLGQEAALASLGDDVEVERRRRVNAEAVADLRAVLDRHGLVALERAVANFLYVETGERTAELVDGLLHEGVIVRPLQGFGAPEAVRITAGTREDHAVLDRALSAVVGGGAQR